MRIAALFVAVLAACGSRAGASPPPPAPSFPNRFVTVGCLEVAVAGAPDTVGQAVQLEVANGCDGAVLIDLRAIAAHGLDAEGRAYLLRPHRTEGNLAPLVVGANSVTREVISLRAVGDPARRLVTTCLDLMRLERSEDGIGSTRRSKTKRDAPGSITGRREVCVPANLPSSTLAHR